MIRPKPRLFLATLVLAAAASAPARAQMTVSTPNVAEAAGSTGLNVPLASSAQTYQAYYSATNFGTVTQPMLITGMQLRLALGTASGVTAGGTYPSQALTFTNYNVQLSRASTAVQSAGGFVEPFPTFAANQGGTVTTARTGALVVPPASFTNTGSTMTPNPYGLFLAFTTPYLYTPGEELVLTVRHTGFQPSTEPEAFFASTGSVTAVADAVSATGFAAATPDGFSNPAFVQYTFVPVPEPGCLLAAAAGAAGLAAVRRRRWAAA